MGGPGLEAAVFSWLVSFCITCQRRISVSLRVWVETSTLIHLSLLLSAGKKGKWTRPYYQRGRGRLVIVSVWHLVAILHTSDILPQPWVTLSTFCDFMCWKSYLRIYFTIIQLGVSYFYYLDFQQLDCCIFVVLIHLSGPCPLSAALAKCFRLICLLSEPSED